MSYSPVGLDKWELDTPTLLIDLARLERNIQRMSSRCHEAGIDWRPHTKGHKIPAIAHKLLDAGAVGITCAKLSEADVMAAGGIRDILVANQVVGERKVARLAGLQRHASVMVGVDHPLQIAAIGQAAQRVSTEVRVLVEVDIGLHRCGVDPGQPAVELAQLAESTSGIVFAGLMGYEGHTLRLPDDEKREACAQAIGLLAETKAQIEATGLSVGIVSAGGTGSLAFTPDCPGVTEVQAGGGIMMDVMYRDGMHVKGMEHALTVLATVVSRPTPDRAVIDAGRKATGGQLQLPEISGRPGLELEAVHAEHGVISVSGKATSLEVGDKIELVAGYSDMTVFLYDQMHGVRDDRVEVVWDILGRGKLQ